jgi:hypothetical protein
LLFSARGPLSWQNAAEAKESRSSLQTLRSLQQADGMAQEMGEELGRGEILLAALFGRGEGGAAVSARERKSIRRIEHLRLVLNRSKTI